MDQHVDTELLLLLDGVADVLLDLLLVLLGADGSLLELQPCSPDLCTPALRSGTRFCSNPQRRFSSSEMTVALGLKHFKKEAWVVSGADQDFWRPGFERNCQKECRPAV